MKNHYVIVTGANRGLGKELALVFAQNHFNVIINDVNNDSFNEITKLVHKFGGECYTITGDLHHKETISEIQKIALKTSVSVLINNAGLHCPYKPLEELTDIQIEKLIEINLTAPIKLTRSIYPIFLQNKTGTIININSLSGLKQHEQRSIYSATKWGLRGFSNSMSIESNKKNIRILDVYPGRIKTRPEFQYGMNPCEVAKKVFNAYQDNNINEIVINLKK